MLSAYVLCLALNAVHGPQGLNNLSEERIQFACNNMDAVLEAAYENKINPFNFAGLIFVESRWAPKAVSRSGACGLTQVLPKYVKYSCKELKDPETSIKVGATSLNRWITKRKKKNEKIALACYNAGNKCEKSKKGNRYSYAVRKLGRKYSRWVKQNPMIRIDQQQFKNIDCIYTANSEPDTINYCY
tara:strand:+ start:672 stop:1232 length:561 start_codon:yes stop_codon:yes gene_type:complete